MPRRRPKVTVIVPAAGAGSRVGGTVKKQFVLLRNKPVLVHTLQRFEHCPDVDEIAVAVPEESIVEMEKLVSHYRLHKVSRVVVGGARRQDSVYHALRGLVLKDSDIVLVHDGVRPFVQPKQISQLVKACRSHDAVVLAVQPKDTVRRSNGGGFFDQTLDRSALWLVQTPQVFKARLLLKAFERARKDKFYSTDEVALVERLGVKAKIIEGSYDNIKITTQEDLELGLLILERWSEKGNA
ncbi:MAG TPA: 2-C-methyl-D-erythritol 4-phosphate cytidylyltransferase [Bacteroidota bacterium]